MPVTINIPNSNNTNTPPNPATPAPMVNDYQPPMQSQTSNQSFGSNNSSSFPGSNPYPSNNDNNKSSNGNSFNSNVNTNSHNNGSSNGSNPDAWWNSPNSIIDESQGKSGSNRRLSPQERVELIEKLFQEVLGRKADTRDINYYKYSTLSEEEMRKQLITGKEHKQLVVDGREFSKMRDRAVQSETRVKILEGQIKDQVQEFQHLTELLDEKNKHIQELRLKLNNPYNLIDHSNDHVINHTDPYRETTNSTPAPVVNNPEVVAEIKVDTPPIAAPTPAETINSFQAPTPEVKPIAPASSSQPIKFVKFLSNKLKEILP